MNQKREADLQRRLSMTAVPTPPPGLAQRIKADIPHDLRVTERKTPRRFLPASFSLRVAASLIVVFGAAYMVLHLATGYDFESIMPNVSKARRVEAAPQSTAEVTIDVAEEPKRPVRVVMTRKAAPPKPAVAQPPQEARNTTANPFAPEIATAKMKDEHAAERPIAVGAAAPAVAAPPAAPAMTADAVSKRSANIAAQAAGIGGRARSDDLAFASPREVFGLSVDPAAFDRVKQKIDQGERPAPGSIDVAALVNYFAGSAKAPRHEVRFDVEGSRAPSAPHDALIHFSVETPRVTAVRGVSPPPIGTDADLTITLNSDAVLSHRLMGADSLKSESMLVNNTSVTGVVEVQLSPVVRPTETVATLRLRYRSAVDGKLRTMTHFVRASELMRNWDSATHRHRLATLSALWSDSVNGGVATSDVARKAEKLATEAPGDARARELAAAATAFSRLQSSGPTGSGR